MNLNSHFIKKPKQETYFGKNFLRSSVLFFILILCIHSIALPQALTISAGAAYNFHLNSGTSVEPQSAAPFQKDIETPAISNFFDNGNSYDFEITYRSRPIWDKSFLFTLIYEHSKLNGNTPDNNLILGEELRINSIGGLLGLALYLNNQNDLFLYGKLGIIFKKYEGSGTYREHQVINKYQDGLFMRLSSGIDFEDIFRLPIALGAGIKLDIGKVKRGDVEVYLDDDLKAKLSPTGDTKIYDHSISFFINLKFILPLGDNKK